MILEILFMNFKLKIEVVGFREHEREIIKKAAYGMVESLGHPDFKEFCLNYKYKIKYCRWKGFKRKCHYKEYNQFYKSGGRTNFQVYNHIMSGQESLPKMTEADGEADVFLKVDRRDKPGVIGWTTPKTKWQYLYSWVLREKDWRYIAGNLTHEWLHKLNYSHSKNSHAKRKHTVTYACGNYTRKFLYDHYDI